MIFMASASAEAAPLGSPSFCRSNICSRSSFTLAISAGESFTSVRVRSMLCTQTARALPPHAKTGVPTHDSRWGRRPEHGTSWPPDVRPGSRSRIGILRRYRLCLPSEPGGSARENVALHFELAVLTPQTLEFLALGRGQPVRTPALVPLSLCHPVADRLRRRLELPL